MVNVGKKRFLFIYLLLLDFYRLQRIQYYQQVMLLLNLRTELVKSISTTNPLNIKNTINKYAFIRIAYPSVY